MKRILPVILVLAVLLLALISCGPKEVPTTTVEITSSTQKRTTSSKLLNMGIDSKDEGWAFWAEN
jgi:predicted small lipoprotein YifL